MYQTFNYFQFFNFQTSFLHKFLQKKCTLLLIAVYTKVLAQDEFNTVFIRNVFSVVPSCPANAECTLDNGMLT
jgi:hypothetical protein